MRDSLSRIEPPFWRVSLSVISISRRTQFRYGPSLLCAKLPFTTQRIRFRYPVPASASQNPSLFIDIYFSIIISFFRFHLLSQIYNLPPGANPHAASFHRRRKHTRRYREESSDPHTTAAAAHTEVEMQMQHISYHFCIQRRQRHLDDRVP